MGQICWFISFFDQMRIISLTVILTLLQSWKHWQDRAKGFFCRWWLISAASPTWEIPQNLNYGRKKGQMYAGFSLKKHCITLTPFSCQDNRTVTDCTITVIWLDKRMYMDRNNTRVSYLIICDNYNQLFQEFVCFFSLSLQNIPES